MLRGTLLGEMGEVPEIRRRDRSAAIDHRYPVSAEELLDRSIGAIEERARVLANRRMKRREQDRDGDPAAAELLDERAERGRAGRGWGDLSGRVRKVVLHRGRERRRAGRGARGDIEPALCLVVALAGYERLEPLLHQEPLAVRRPDAPDLLVDHADFVDRPAERIQIRGRKHLASEQVAGELSARIDEPG